MTKSCNDSALNKFRAQLRDYIEYYYLVSGACHHVQNDPTVHLIWPGKKKGVDNIYELHERNVTDLMENRPKLARLMWFCHLRMQLIPGAILRCPRSDLTRDILWDDELSKDIPAAVPLKVLYEVKSTGLATRTATYATGITVDNEMQYFTEVKYHTDYTKDTWPNGVTVEIERRADKQEAA